MRTIDGIHESFDGDVQYPYADVGEPNLMHISGITQENRRSYSYTCPYCKKSMSPRLGKKNTHCFAHKSGARCDLDRYIHTTAERLLKEKWDRDEPFEITMKVKTECKEMGKCLFYKDYSRCVNEEVMTYDLKKQYSRCVVEKKYGEFIPDLCLIDDKGKHKPIFIEIWSKHKNSEKKAKSDHMIIEIRLKTTEDLEELPKHPITESETTTFRHFKTLKKSPSKEDSPQLMRFTLYAKTLKSFVNDHSVFCSNFRMKHYAKSLFEIVCSSDDFYSTNDFWSYCNAIALDRGYDIRSCYFCHLYGSDWRGKDYYDEILNPNRLIGCRRDLEVSGLIKCKPEEALTCQFFAVKKNLFQRIKARYSNINRYIWIRNADGTESEEIHRRE